MKILICDNEQRHLDNIQNHVSLYMQNHFVPAEFFVTTEPQSIMKNETAFDLAFLDVEMPEMDGISVAKELKRRNSRVVLFLVTAFDQYLDEAMDLHVFRFFEKPLNIQRLYASLDKAMEYLDETYVDVFFYGEDGTKKVCVDNIILVKTENRKTYVLTTNGEFITRETMDDWRKKIPNTFFCAVHKSFLINLHYVTAYHYRELYLNEKIRIPISSRNQAAFHKYWFNYLQRR